jgi:hypothetical protein
MIDKRTIESEFRDFKIKLFSGDIKLSVSNDIISKNKRVLDFILDNFSDDIISGSLALSLYGLMNHRVIKDIDILIKDKNRYSGYIKNYYGELIIDNRLGYKDFDYVTHSLFGIWSRKTTYDVDFFLELEKTEYYTIEYRGYNLKIHNPIQIISHKVDMAEKDYKHKRDLYYIFNIFV